MADTPTCVQPVSCAKKKATEIDQAQLGQEQESTIMEIQTSDEQQTISREKSISHLSDKIKEMKSKIDVKKLKLDEANKRRMIDKVCAHICLYAWLLAFWLSVFGPLALTSIVLN